MPRAAPCPDVFAESEAGAQKYARRTPEKTILYQVVLAHLATLLAEAREVGRELPRYVERAFHAYLRCGILAHGFLRAYCRSCRTSTVVALSCKQRGPCPSCGARRMKHAS